MRKEGDKNADVLPVPKPCVASVFHVDRVALNLRNILADTYTQYKLSWLDTKGTFVFQSSIYSIAYLINAAYDVHCSCKLKGGGGESATRAGMLGAHIFKRLWSPGIDFME